MLYDDDKPSGRGFPLIAIHLAIAAILCSLVIVGDHREATTNVWLPENSTVP